ncbi:hypothetical protein SAMN05660909_03657 [Chitinophaga terrae (ex Kim and Jung 2007)]|uniref:Uncharacterized protein n=1 Tax=Chitinophaga terrae (ex Kim and Jung 2007) TaxID=408074 RepID=A0A1H4ED16_9BACT|nr:hypothetical protein CTE07_32160 [Chitinophaga terrae (ex Kim and Jung 2007)]SEA82836.1 hypothetical protein SAMN05660909_03657 [Chitinophaga terrae (ex Kim and Jung 2007)]
MNYLYLQKLIPVKSFVLLSFAVLFLFACHSGKPENNTIAVAATDSSAFKNLINVYKADFGNGVIYINLNFFNGKDVGGYNIHNGLRRNIHGTARKENNNWIVTLAEPGDHPLDGVFTLTFDAGFSQCDGNWKANNTRYAEKNFKLEKITPSEEEGFFNDPTFDFVFVDYSASKSELHFQKDGSCELKLYKRITDSTYADQLITLKGSYQKENDSTIRVTWKANDILPEQSDFVFEYNDQKDDNYHYPIGIHGEDYHFLPVF